LRRDFQPYSCAIRRGKDLTLTLSYEERIKNIPSFFPKRIRRKEGIKGRLKKVKS
jgi:hypothetical protein